MRKITMFNSELFSQFKVWTANILAVVFSFLNVEEWLKLIALVLAITYTCLQIWAWLHTNKKWWQFWKRK
jgi:hypothetical protein